MTSVLIVGYQFNVPNQLDSSISSLATHNTVAGERRAYASFLSTNTSWDELDHYYTAMRTVVYKLLRDPETGTRIGTEFVVMVNDDVKQEKIDQLEKDGAIVRHFEDICNEWAHPSTERWVDQVTKLRLWEMTEWDRMLYIDADMIVLKSLDGIWLDPAALPQKNDACRPTNGTKLPVKGTISWRG